MGDCSCILQVGTKRRRLQEDDDILGPVQRQEVQESTLVQRLHEYVERIDTDMVTPTQSRFPSSLRVTHAFDMGSIECLRAHDGITSVSAPPTAVNTLCMSCEKVSRMGESDAGGSTCAAHAHQGAEPTPCKRAVARSSIDAAGPGVPDAAGHGRGPAAGRVPNASLSCAQVRAATSEHLLPAQAAFI